MAGPGRAPPDAHGVSAADAGQVEALLLAIGVALTMTGDAVSGIQRQLRRIATAHGYEHAHISVLPTFLIVLLRAGEPAGVRSVDTGRELRLDHASAVIQIARRAETAELEPSQSLADLGRALASQSRFTVSARIAAHSLLTVGSGS